MTREYESPCIDVVTVDADVITSSSWELPKEDWDW